MVKPGHVQRVLLSDVLQCELIYAESYKKISNRTTSKVDLIKIEDNPKKDDCT